MKNNYLFAALVWLAVLIASCDNRNTDSRDLTAPENVNESQVTNPSTATPSPTPAGNSEEQHKAGY